MKASLHQCSYMIPGRVGIWQQMKNAPRRGDPGQKRVVYGPERAFLIAWEGRAFFREDAISFFRGDTDPGNLTTFQKQSLCFSILLFHFNSSFSLNCVANFKHVSRKGENGYRPVLQLPPVCCPSAFTNYKLHIDQVGNGQTEKLFSSRKHPSCRY